MYLRKIWNPSVCSADTSPKTPSAFQGRQEKPSLRKGGWIAAGKTGGSATLPPLRGTSPENPQDFQGRQEKNIFSKENYFSRNLTAWTSTGFHLVPLKGLPRVEVVSIGMSSVSISSTSSSSVRTASVYGSVT